MSTVETVDNLSPLLRWLLKAHKAAATAAEQRAPSDRNRLVGRCGREVSSKRAAHNKQGYQVEIEASRDPNDAKQGRVDVLATKTAKRASESARFAIEIETGKSDVVANVKRDLLTGFERVLVVATDEKAMKQVDRQLCGEGLFIPGRVDVELAIASSQQRTTSNSVAIETEDDSAFCT